MLSFNMKNLIRYFSTPTISLGFFSSLFSSAFIYMHHFNIHLPLLQALLGIVALWFWLKLSPKEMFWSGFFTAIFWFYWIALSFRYYDLNWMIPFVIVGIGIIFGILFRLIAAFPHILLRAVAIGLIEYLHPLGFDWFRPALMFTNSALGDHIWQLWIIISSLTIFIMIKQKTRYLALLLILLSIQYSTFNTQNSTLNIQLVNTNIDQDKKWDPRYLHPIVELNMQAIQNALNNKKKAVILPESAFPLFLNYEIELMKKLLDLSNNITIITGALYAENGKSYNSTYLFKDGKVRVMHKVILVPFGEEVPLPKWMAKWINDLFFDGASDYATARDVSDFKMIGKLFRNAICYEATSDKLFEGDPKYMVAISNNKWFTPSIEPTLQHLLLQMQSNRHSTTIFHSTNGPITGIIVPH
ncbi:Apolipoprotein N-acyltransferase [Hydrogenimonas thermophila]|uniref:Apolipoprotein N-acyltransferase n=2 Tax=Hydrogenimonas thermophila TaxID=223786 RepID=A0A1I5N2Z2_9BACT|nr:Apolipoprotein N-acyltransferase [Hydrogenimonas thermophila]